MEEKYVVIMAERLRRLDAVALLGLNPGKIIILFCANEVGRRVRRFCIENRILVLNTKKVRMKELL